MRPLTPVLYDYGTASPFPALPLALFGSDAAPSQSATGNAERLRATSRPALRRPACRSRAARRSPGEKAGRPDTLSSIREDRVTLGCRLRRHLTSQRRDRHSSNHAQHLRQNSPPTRGVPLSSTSGNDRPQPRHHRGQQKHPPSSGRRHLATRAARRPDSTQSQTQHATRTTRLGSWTPSSPTAVTSDTSRRRTTHRQTGPGAGDD